MTNTEILAAENTNGFRYQCRSCKARGRWRTNPNDASADGERHYDKHTSEHECFITNQEGKDVGPCH